MSDIYFDTNIIIDALARRPQALAELRRAKRESCALSQPGIDRDPRDRRAVMHGTAALLHPHQQPVALMRLKLDGIKCPARCGDRGVDLIVLGSRERHGLSIMFNQTEDTILHSAPCDVLAVRWKKT